MRLLPPDAMLLVSALLFCRPTLGSATTVVLTPEVLQFIPLCAQPCFERFIVYEFPSISSPPTGLSLNWLCTQSTNTSGDLTGAGAGDCVQVAINEGYCNKDPNNDPLSHLDVEIARNMCSRGEAIKDPIPPMEKENLSWKWTSPLLSILFPTTTGGKIALWSLGVIGTGIAVAALRAHRMRQRVLGFNLNGSSAPFQSAEIREKGLVEEAG